MNTVTVVPLPRARKIAHNAQEACQFINVGFDYVTGEYNDGGKIFRKRN